MSTMTKQDLFTVTEVAKNKIIERLVTKYDVQVACDSMRDRILAKLQEMQLDNQALLRQINAQNDHAWRKIAALEGKMANLQTEVKTMRRLLAGRADAVQDPQDSESDFSPLPVK